MNSVIEKSILIGILIHRLYIRGLLCRPLFHIIKYCCPIKLVSFHRYVLGYRSVDSRVPFFISKPLYPNNNSCSMNLCSVLASISSQSFSGKLNRL